MSRQEVVLQQEPGNGWFAIKGSVGSTPAGRLQPHPHWRSLAWSAGLLTLITIGIGLGAEYVWQAADTATEVLLVREPSTDEIVGAMPSLEAFPSR